MSASEGVIKFDLEFSPGPAPAPGQLRELEAWRRIFRRLGLLGQDPQRYAGLGFGNLSRRAGPGTPADAFIVSGTQTGGLERLTPADYAVVLRCDPHGNRVTATGLSRPSSEALSHGVLYQANPRIDWVMHLHSPEIFAAGAALHLPVTDPNVPYGSPQMAAEILRLCPAAGLPGLLIMGGHEDGILAFGGSAAATGTLVLATLAAALACHDTTQGD